MVVVQPDDVAFLIFCDDCGKSFVMIPSRLPDGRLVLDDLGRRVPLSRMCHSCLVDLFNDYVARGFIQPVHPDGRPFSLPDHMARIEDAFLDA